jgi:hypothetical protein
MIAIAAISWDITGQAIPDREFAWRAFPECGSGRIDAPVYRKVEQDPVITGMTEEEFDQMLRDSWQRAGLDARHQCTVKIKIWFVAGEVMCVSSLGTRSLSLQSHQIEVIVSGLKLTAAFNPGRQNDIVKNCEGIVILDITQGAVHGIRKSNMTFLE